jgi:hypothetical protein
MILVSKLESKLIVHCSTIAVCCAELQKIQIKKDDVIIRNQSSSPLSSIVIRNISLEKLSGPSNVPSEDWVQPVIR